MRLSTSALALLSFGSLAAAASIVAHTGTPVGEDVVYNGLNLYVSNSTVYASNSTANTTDSAVLYLTDVFGIQLAQNKLLADSFARAGYLTVAPDLFNGTPAPNDINQPGFNSTQFITAHGPNVTDPIIASTISYLRDTLGIKKIAVTGYCFGGRYAFRFLAPGQGADVAFAAHPSLLEDSEILAISGPASIAAAETDTLMPATRRSAIESLLQQTKKAYSLALYAGTSHGFGVRANISDPMQKFGKEEAFVQAVRFFNNWL